MSNHILNCALVAPSQDQITAAGLDSPINFVVSSLPPVVDLRHVCPPVYDQGQLGSCTGQASRALREILGLIAGKPTPSLSSLFVYWNERSAEHTIDQDAGAQIVDALAVLLHEGAAPESLDPYDITQFKIAPTETAFKAAEQYKITTAHHIYTLDDLLANLAAGYPFICGIPVFSGDHGLESSYVAGGGVVSMPNPSDQVLGGHAVCVVGYNLAEQLFLVRNSWGSDWGEHGYFWIPFDYIVNLGNSFWTARL